MLSDFLYKKIVIVPFFVKVVQTAVAHACDLAVHLVTAQPRRAKTDPVPYSAQKKDLAPRCIHRSQTEPVLELEKNSVIYFD